MGIVGGDQGCEEGHKDQQGQNHRTGYGQRIPANDSQGFQKGIGVDAPLGSRPPGAGEVIGHGTYLPSF